MENLHYVERHTHDIWDIWSLKSKIDELEYMVYDLESRIDALEWEVY